jgi:hypothetical protein
MFKRWIGQMIRIHVFGHRVYEFGGFAQIK